MTFNLNHTTSSLVIIFYLLSCSLSCTSSKLAPDPNPYFNAGASSDQDKSTNKKTSDCLENRMAVDIGSGSTKVLIAEVNFCLQTIQKIHFKESHPLKIKELLLENKNQIPDSVLEEATKVILSWKEKHQNLKLQKYTAVATEVFRQAKNGNQILKKISDATQIPIERIDQILEAKIGFYSALSLSQNSADEIVVWDIGGGSMQITSLAGPRKFNFYQGRLASVNFKDIILDLKNKNLKEQAKSPNPLGPKLTSTAIAKAERYAKLSVPGDIKQDLKSKKLLGIGGVHFYSVYRQVETLKTPQKQPELEKSLPGKKAEVKITSQTEKFFTSAEIQKVLDQKMNFNDKQLEGSYPETDITNLALVLGFMKALNVDKVVVWPADLTFGLIVMPDKI